MLLYKLLIMQKLLKAKAHMGFCSTFSDTQPYIYGYRNKIAIINLDKTLIYLRRACSVIDLIISSKGRLLFVNTNPEYNKIVKETAQRANQSYLNHKWIGGFLTNWNHMQNVQQHFMLLSSMAASKAQINKAEFISEVNSKNSSKMYSYGKRPLGEPCTMYSRQNITTFLTPRFKKMQKCFEGSFLHSHSTNTSNFNGTALRKKDNYLPDCIILFNATQNSKAIHEASLLQIPIISIVDSNISNKLHNLITYPIPANENSVHFIYIVCNCFLKTILRSRLKKN